MAKTVKEMIELSVTSLEKLDKNASQKLYMMDDSVDSVFRNYLKKAITQTKKRNFEPKCYVSVSANTSILGKNLRPCLLHRRLCTLRCHRRSKPKALNNYIEYVYLYDNYRSLITKPILY